MVRVSQATPAGEPDFLQACGDFLDEREQSTVFTHLCAFHGGSRVNLACPGSPAEGLGVQYVTADFFRALGLVPTLGRSFNAEEEQPGRDDVAILSQDFWARRFNRDPQIVGRTLRLDGKPTTVVGVVPMEDNILLFEGRVDVLRPLAFSPGQRQDREHERLTVVGRLKPRVRPKQAQAEMSAIARRIAPDHPPQARFNLLVSPLGESLVRSEDRRGFWLLFALAGFVLLVACVNLANLQLARLTARSRELGIRAAVGAGRLRLARQLLTETLVLSLLGGALGLPLALAANCWLGHQFVFDPYSLQGLDIPLDRAVVGFAFLITLASGVLVGTAPAWLIVRGDLNSVLKEDGRTLSAGLSRHRMQNTLVVAEMALALMLLVCVGEMAVPAWSEWARDPGWRPDGLTVGKITLTGPAYDSAQKQADFLRRLEERIGALPGVERVSLSSGLPFEPAYGWRPLAEGETEPRSLTAVYGVDLNYFRTLGMVLRQGRDFAAEEIEKGAPVVIISPAVAEQLWPGENPVGKRISWDGDAQKRRIEVIGVINPISGNEGFQAYRPRGGLGDVTVLIRTADTAEALAPALRNAVAGLDPDLPVLQIRTARRLLEQVSAASRACLWMVEGFGLLGLLLAAVGIYGVTAHAVSRRVGEFGIRMALGASRGSVLWLVLRQGLRLSLLGTVLGLPGGYALLRVIRALQEGSVPKGLIAEAWPVAVGTGAVLVAVALLACWLPARRATRIDPMAALRCE